jgi:c-di-GMP-binding flagellar brake protein YcgR
MGNDGFYEFRLGSADEVLSMLKRLQGSRTVLNLSTPSGATLSSSLLTIDEASKSLTLSADADSPQLRALVDASETVAVAYLESIKVQFDVHGLVAVRGGQSVSLRCALPSEMFRFQRRECFRVRPLLRSEPIARFLHPARPDIELSLRVLDVSIGGCALLLPSSAPAIEPGVTVDEVELELDADTHITVPMRLLHTAAMAEDTRGAKLGCEFVKPSNENLRALQRYIDQTQKKRRLMALD